MMTRKSRFIPSYLTGEPVQPESSDESSQNPIPRQSKHIRPREIQHLRKVKSNWTWRWLSDEKEA